MTKPKRGSRFKQLTYAALDLSINNKDIAVTEGMWKRGDIQMMHEVRSIPQKHVV